MSSTTKPNLNNYHKQLTIKKINEENTYTKTKLQQIKNTINEIEKLKLKQQQLKSNLLTQKLTQQNIPENGPIQSIKSLYNQQVISVLPITDPDTYQINLNNNCLTVYNRDNVLLKDCQKNMNISDSQKFITKRIQNPADAKLTFGKQSFNKNIIYPYNIFQSNLTNQCLTLNNDGEIILNNCSPDNINQHWKISPQQNSC